MALTTAGHNPQALNVLTGALHAALKPAVQALLDEGVPLSAERLAATVFNALHDAGLRIVDREDVGR